MNWSAARARAFEQKRRRIAKAGPKPPKPKGPLAAITSKMVPEQRAMQAWRSKAADGREFAKDHYSENPVANLTRAEELRMMAELGEGLFEARHGGNDELQELGGYIAFTTGATWIPGPIKEVGGRTEDRGAFQKTVKDYHLDWSANKDLIRGTLAAETDSHLSQVVARTRIICSPEFGMNLIKDSEVKASNTKGCGYSGYNFVVVMKESPIPAEIQANTLSMMYAKMSKGDYVREILGGNEAEYVRTKNRMGFEGGLQHLFYEIYQSGDTHQAEKDLAAALSREYTNLTRTSPMRMAAGGPGMTAQISAFESKLTSRRAIEIWGKRGRHLHG